MLNNSSRPQKYTARVEAKTEASAKVHKISLRMLEPTEINFIPGQFISLKVSPTNYRSYSIASDAQNKHELAILVATGHDGVGANYLKELKVGDTVEFVGPAGKFTLPNIIGKKLVMVATGTGLSPILSMLATLADQQCTSKIELFLGVRDDSELMETTTLAELAEKLPNFNLTICFSDAREEQVHKWKGFSGRVTDKLDIKAITDAQHPSQVLMCGNPHMVHELYTKLLENGAKEENLFHEKFTTSAPKTASL